MHAYICICTCILALGWNARNGPFPLLHLGYPTPWAGGARHLAPDAYIYIYIFMYWSIYTYTYIYICILMFSPLSFSPHPLTSSTLKIIASTKYGISPE